MKIPTDPFLSLRSLLLGASLLAAVTASASDLLVDRGLPTANLNNVSGSNRSNVSFTFGGQGDEYFVTGDSFSNTASGTYFIDTIRLWVVGAFDANSLSLWGGLDNGATSTISSSYTTQGVTYVGGQTYQTRTGPFDTITQVDFAVNISVNPGQTYDFFLDGTGGEEGIPFAHASNAPLSGSPQDGADNLFLYGYINGGVFMESGAIDSLNNSWDKSADLNVQIYGEVPDSGTTVAFLGLGVLGLAGFSLRRRAAKA